MNLHADSCRLLFGLLVSLLLRVSAVAFMGDGAMAFDQIRRIEPGKQTGTSAAVVAPDAALIHTVQFLPSAEHRVPTESAEGQLKNLLDQLHDSLNEAGASSIVKVNLYVTSEDVAAEIRRALPLHFSGDDQPAVSLVVSRLEIPDAMVALDAVACHRGKEPRSILRSRGSVTLPRGTRIYVSGQAEQSESLAEATQKTLAGLHNTLTFLGRSDDDIVQLKAFIQPMEDAAAVREQVEKFFDGKPVPPLVLVEWKSGSRTPVEIELIAWGGEAEAETPQMEFLTPPGMTASPIYCRVCRISAPQTIYVSGLYSGDSSLAAAGGADQEVRNVFAELERILKLTGSDLQHLAKATYYVSTDDASTSLNRLRPGYYDSTRPPAASKAVVRSVGVTGLGLTMDMIAVPTR